MEISAVVYFGVLCKDANASSRSLKQQNFVSHVATFIQHWILPCSFCCGAHFLSVYSNLARLFFFFRHRPLDFPERWCTEMATS